MTQEEINDKVLDDILSLEQGRSRIELYNELTSDSLLWGWRARPMYWWAAFYEWRWGARAALGMCLSRLYSGHNEFLGIVMKDLEAAVQGESSYEIARAEIRLTTYRRRLFALVTLTAPSGFGEVLVGHIIGEYDRQLQAQMNLKAPSVFVAQEAQEGQAAEEASSSG